MRAPRRWALLFLCACAAVLAGCAAAPPQSVIRSDSGAETLISADTAGLAPASLNAALYFRYGDTAYLASQTRAVEVRRDETAERAVVQALLDGPAGARLEALFPPDTEVLATLSQGDTLFITFNEAFAGRYADEKGDAGVSRAESELRRQLCLDALAATLTEAGLCARVQVLVYRGVGQDTSMRLTRGFLDQSGDETPLPPLTRNEERLLTAHNTAALALSAWQKRDWAALYDLTARADEAARPGEQAAFDAFAEGRTLVRCAVSPGSVAQDGRTAVVTADLSFQGEAGDAEAAGYPLRLVREDGLWKLGYESLIRMMRQE